MRIVRAAEPSAGRRWEFLMPDGTPHREWYEAPGLINLLERQGSRRQVEFDAIIGGIDGSEHPDAARIVPGWRGEAFDLHECVQALFRMRPSGVDSRDAA
jgi:hypothetical protein